MPTTKPTLHLISLGCAKNLVDSEILLGGLKHHAYQLTKEPEEADTIIINTCGFLDQAREESIEVVLQAAQLKKTGRLKQLVVMGCLSERYPVELAREIPEVDRFFGTHDHGEIISYLTGKDHSRDDPRFFRSLLTPRHYAYLRVAEGCDNGCSFCSIPLMRGAQKSRPLPEIVTEAQKLLDMGVKELLIIAQDTTSYGWDLPEKISLADVITALDSLPTDEYWIRIHYTHPAHLSRNIIAALANATHVCRYLDIPVQHASDRILTSMRRGLNKAGIRRRIQQVRNAIPDIRLRTTLIVGYPGETEAEFQELLDFVAEIQFDRLGVFTYSEEEGTLAARLPDDIPRDLKDERKATVLELQADISAQKQAALVGTTMKVLVDETHSEGSLGRTEFDSPEVDNVVHITGEVLEGTFIPVKIESSTPYDLYGSPLL
ncbi:MAG: 30S ribosomal protein S12 methylthiotransferase RimO [Fidelibacterota bacterium]